MTQERDIGDLSDEALMLRVRDNDHQAFAELMKRYERQLQVFIYRQLGDHEISRDLLMDTFLRIYKAAPRYEPRAKFSTYIYQIARNLCINEYRKRKTRMTESLDQLGSDTGLEVAGRELDPAEQMERQERRDIVQRALDSLPEDQRTILILAEYQDIRYERIAEIMGCSVGTIKSRMFRARKKIREWMENYEL